MKHLIKIKDFKLNEKFNKAYENKGKNKISIFTFIPFFYYIPYTDKTLFELAVNKISIRDKLKTQIIEDSNNFIMLGRIGFFISIFSHTYYTYYSVDDSEELEIGYSHYIRNYKNIIYKGEIKLEDYEIAANKYNLL